MACQGQFFPFWRFFYIGEMNFFIKRREKIRRKTENLQKKLVYAELNVTLSLFLTINLKYATFLIICVGRKWKWK